MTARYRMIVTPIGGETFLTAELDRALFTRLAEYFIWCESDIRSYWSRNGKRWRLFHPLPTPPSPESPQ